jgi:PAS domain S-box-containing protein
MADDERVRILFVEDVPTDAELAERELRRNGLAYEARRVETEPEFRAALAEFVPDVVISDYSMPGFDGMSALLLAKAADPFLPFIVLTGSMNEDTAVACMKAGASDYVIKEHLSRLVFAVREAIARGKMKLKSAEQELRLSQSEERYRSIFTNSNAAMLIIDPADRTIVDANRAAVAFYGWPKEELIGKDMSELNTIGPEQLREQIRKAVLMEKNLFRFKHRRADGGAVDVEVHAGPIAIAGSTYLFSIVHDISQRMAAQAERDALALKLSRYLATSPTITYSIKVENGAARWEWISENVGAILGYSQEEALKPDWWFDRVHAADRPLAIGGIAQLAKSGEHAMEYRFARRDRAVVWLRDDMRLAKTDGGIAEIVGTLTDISASKRAEAEIRLNSAALEAADNAMVITDRNGAIESTNPAFERLTGYTAAEALGRNPRELIKSGSQNAAFYRELWDAIGGGRVWRGELVNKRKNGELYREEMTIAPVMDESKRIEHFIAIKSDVTERTRAKANLETSLREKDALLREVHHRVKNNLQVIISLLTLSGDNFTDPAARSALEEVIRRIGAMAVVHEQFYEAADLDRIDFSLYLKRLATALLDDGRTTALRPDLSCDAAEAELSLEEAIPAGMIVSELISNALRYAFADTGRRGALALAVRRGAGYLEIEVRDDGAVAPADSDPLSVRAQGDLLIGLLADQLHGTVAYTYGDGTAAVLRFPYAAG